MQGSRGKAMWMFRAKKSRKPNVEQAEDLTEQGIFFGQRNLFSGRDLVFFDTTSIYFEGHGGEELGRKAFSKDHPPGSQADGGGAVTCQCHAHEHLAPVH